MSVLQRIRDAVFGKRIVDPTFGKLVFDRTEFLVREGEPRSGRYFEYWQGLVEFPPLEYAISVCLPGGCLGPSNEQRVLFDEIVTRWPSLIEPLKAALHPPYEYWFKGMPQEALTADEMFASLRLEGLRIEHPTLDLGWKQNRDFTAAFYVPGEAGHSLVADIKDWNVIRAYFTA